MLPLIGITGLRSELGPLADDDRRFADRLVDHFFADFSGRVRDAGGVPVLLPFEADVATLVRRLDGVIVTGGQDVHPRHWGGDESVVDPGRDPRQQVMAHDDERDLFEMALVRAAVAGGLPVLGVCRGNQLLNVTFGGTLVVDVPNGNVRHDAAEAAPFDGAGDHVVRFLPGSLAASLYGEQARTNAWHHQAVAECGAGLVVSGRTSDGVVESIEMPGRPVLGVQWHPEWRVGPDPVFPWLVAASARQGQAMSPGDPAAAAAGRPGANQDVAAP